VTLHAAAARLVDEQVRERVRQMARQRDELVVGLGVDRDRRRAECRDEAVNEAVALGVGLRGRGQEPGRAVEEIDRRVGGAVRLRAGYRMAADKARVARRVGDIRLRRADVGDRRAAADGEQLAQHGLKRRHGYGRDDQVGVVELAGSGDRLVDRAALSRHLQRLGGEVVPRDVADPRTLRGEPDRRADQAGADDAEPLDLHRPRLTARGQRQAAGPIPNPHPPGATHASPEGVACL
jgi:hypothetical protein